MAQWDEILAELTQHYMIAAQREDEALILCDRRRVLVRRVSAFSVDWLRVSASIGAAGDLALDPLLRRAGDLVGAVAIEGARIVLRETVCLAYTTPMAVHALIAVIGRQARELSGLSRGGRSHPYADQFAT
jgi:hypothetical protein